MSIEMTEGLKEFELNEAQDKLLLFSDQIVALFLLGVGLFLLMRS